LIKVWLNIRFRIFNISKWIWDNIIFQTMETTKTISTIWKYQELRSKCVMYFWVKNHSSVKIAIKHWKSCHTSIRVNFNLSYSTIWHLFETSKRLRLSNIVNVLISNSKWCSYSMNKFYEFSLKVYKKIIK